MTGSPIILPAPPQAYSQLTEAVRNANIKAAIDRKLDVNSPSVFGGLPQVSLRGSNANFNAVNGAAFVLVPFDTQVKNTDADLAYSSGSSSVTPSFDMDMSFSVRMPWSSVFTLDGSSVDFYVGIFENGSLKTAQAKMVKLSQYFDVSIYIAMSLLANRAYDIRLQHTYSSPVQFDLTNSSWRLLRISPNPAVAAGQ